MYLVKLIIFLYAKAQFFNVIDEFKFNIVVFFGAFSKTILRTMIYSSRGGTDHAVEKGRV